VTRDPRLLTAIAVGLSGVAVALSLVALRPDLGGRPPTEHLGTVPLAVLDTVALAGRIVTAELDGTVDRTDGDTVWLAVRGAPFPVVVRDTVEWLDTSRLLVVGRLRETHGRRHLRARDWTLVDGAVVSAPDSGRVSPTPFTPVPDRSGGAGDRSDD
jgi:hypothetical protein